MSAKRLVTSLEPNSAQAAFQKAVQRLDNLLSEDSELREFLSGHIDIVSIHDAVAEAQRRFEQNGNSKARKWMTRLSAKIHLYGKVLDVFVQQHPEYVSLVWGTFKLLFAGVVNQEELTKELAKALCRIADALPQTERDLLLYPSSDMEDLVATLYAHIISFAQRAVHWYTESKIKHAVSSIMRPYSLRFKDTVIEVSETSLRIERLACSMSRAELRQARLELQENLKELQLIREENKVTQDALAEMRSLLERHHTLQYSGLLDTNQRIGQVQLSQILTFASSSSLPLPEECRRLYLPKRHRRIGIDQQCSTVFQFTPELQRWSVAHASSLIAICNSSGSNERMARISAISLIELIAAANVPVVWALTPRIQSTGVHFQIDVVKHLAFQAIQRNSTLHNERAVGLSAVRFQTAVTAKDWFDRLATVLDGIPQIYIIIDLSVLGFDSDLDTPWPILFSSMFGELAARGSQTIVKVVFVCPSSRQQKKLGDTSEVQILPLQDLRSNKITKYYRRQRIGRLSAKRLFSQATMTDSSP